MPAFVTIEVAEERLALPAAVVEGVLRMAALAPLHGAPDVVEGVLDLHGELVPVVDLRAALGLERRAARPEDHLVLARAPSGRVALRVDRVLAVAEVDDASVAAAGAWSWGASLVAGAVRLPDGLAVVEDLPALLRGLPTSPRAAPAAAAEPP